MRGALAGELSSAPGASGRLTLFLFFAPRAEAVPQHQEVADHQQHQRDGGIGGEPAYADVRLAEVMNESGEEDQEDDDRSRQQPGTESTQYRQWATPRTPRGPVHGRTGDSAR
jgi:hypothetical protein